METYPYSLAMENRISIRGSPVKSRKKLASIRCNSYLIESITCTGNSHFYKPDPSKFHVTIKNMTMNWNLIFKLSLFGLAMGIATVYWIPSNIEPYFWLVIFIICAYAIAKNCQENISCTGSS